MSQSILLVWQDERGKEIDSCNDVNGNFALALWVANKEKTTCLQYIDPYGDTYFNVIQIPILIEELKELISTFRKLKVKTIESNYGDVSVEDVCKQISSYIDFSKKAVGKNHTYLRFVGD